MTASTSSTVLAVSIALIGVNIVVLCSFAIFSAVECYLKSRKKEEPLIDKREIRYFTELERSDFKTRPIPLPFHEKHKHFEQDGFMIPIDGEGSRARVSDTSETSSAIENLDISSYFADARVAEQLDEAKPLDIPPSVLVSFFYDVTLHELNVTLVRGKNFSDDAEPVVDHVCISVVLLPDGSIYHSSFGVPPNPMFKDKFIFPITVEDLKTSRVKLNVWRIDKYSKKNPTGEIVASLEQLFDVKEDNVYANKISIWRDVEPKTELTNETSLGEILSSLQYLPGAERVNVTVMKGRDLKLEEFDKDVYVKVTSVVNGRILKNKKTAVLRKKRSPLFNETVSFQLDPDANITLESMYVILSVYTYRSRGPHRRLIGRAILGGVQHAGEKGKQHWKRMIEMPQKVFAEWQELRLEDRSSSA